MPTPPPFPPPDRVGVSPPLGLAERAVLTGLTGTGATHRIWTGQPGARSPWRPCADGCCLLLDGRTDQDPATWLRFLIREVLSPRARAARERAAVLGLGEAHRVDGDLVVEIVTGWQRLRVVNNRITLHTVTRRVSGGATAPRPMPRPRGEVMRREPPSHDPSGPAS